jgi:hypothetical protein
MNVNVYQAEATHVGQACAVPSSTEQSCWTGVLVSPEQ